MPSLEWEENVFLGLKALYKSVLVSPKDRANKARQAELSNLKSELLLLAQMLSGKRISLFETDDQLLYVDERICLPKQFYRAKTPEGNRDYYILRTVAASLAIRNKLYEDNSTIDSLILLCQRELPQFATRLLSLENNIEDEDEDDLFPRLPLYSECRSLKSDGLKEIDPAEEQDNSAITELEGQGRVNVVEVKEGETGEQDTPFHTFEKAETLDEYSGLSRQEDAEDELIEHEEALSKLKMDSIIRTADRSQSVYKADIMIDGIGFETQNQKLKGIPYSEWDYKRRSYRRDWCFVQEGQIEQLNPEWVISTRAKHSALILSLKKKFATLATEWLKKKRHTSGDEVDIDAAIELLVRLLTNEAPPEYLYVGANKSLPKAATMILIDTSYSTDSWVEDRCVMDVMKETVFCIAEVLADANQQLGIYGFSSNTRQSCSVNAIKRFSEDWNHVRGRLGGLGSSGYTRIGPALRHAYSVLSKQEVDRKLLILLTDGKPCDYDRYEGRYGIEDVRKAIKEGKAAGVSTHAFAIDKQARDYFPIMFSRSNFDIVSHPNKLIGTLFQLYLRLRMD